MANIITHSVRQRATGAIGLGNPLSDQVRVGKKYWCKTCEKMLADKPELDHPKEYGCHDVPDGDVPFIERLLEMREVGEGTGIYLHRWNVGQYLHEAAVKEGY